MRRLHIVVISGLGVALLASGGIIVQQARKLAEVRQQKDAALRSLHETREALRQSQLRLASALQQSPTPAGDGKATLAKRDATIQQLTSELNTAQASITQLQKNLSASKDENQKAAETSTRRYKAMQVELQTRLEQVQKQLDSVQADLESSHQRIASLQKENDQLNAANNEGSTRAAEREHILQSLQDLDRRREAYLTSIADRYRNLTNQFRTMSGMLASNRGQDSNTLSGPALDMIQNAISLTDNDLQHLNELNAKAYRLEQRLAKK
jgi:chromosome segregation ATPase